MSKFRGHKRRDHGGRRGGRQDSFPNKGRRQDQPQRRGPVFSRPGRAVGAEAILEALAKIPTGGTASQIATAMQPGQNDRDLVRDISQSLRRLVEQGRVLEVRPGRYQVSGSGGEFPVVIDKGVATPLQARFSDERVMPVHPRHTLGARVGDVCQAVIGEDGYALLTRILRRTGREVVGTVNFRPNGMLFIPDNRREGELRVLSSFKDFEKQYQAGDRILATIEIDAEGRAGVNISKILGDESPEVADFMYTCLTHDLPGEFPEEVEDQARSFDNDFSVGRREDLRDKLVFTIDPATAKDFDDAISLEPRKGGGWILGVHIADVSNYVREGTPLDDEAASRGTSVYLINRVISMLPEVLSNGLCSLVPNEDRYCLSAFLELDARCNLIATRLSETIINSRHRLTYEEALAVLEKKEKPGYWPEDLLKILREVNHIAQSLRAQRERAGALNLYSVEHRFKLDVNGLPIEVGQEVSDISHQLIEECMLLANRAVAAWLEKHGMPCVYRIHEQPDADRLEQFAHILEAYGMHSEGVQDRFGLQRILKKIANEPEAAKLVLNFMCLRSFKKAVYGTDNIGHYALAFESYAHFTSPIRRYPDLLVHRLVKRALNLPDFKNVENRRSYIDALAKQSSYLEQRAELAERTLHARKSARYLSARIGETFPGVVTGATGGALFVQLMETGMEGMVPVRELADDYYEFDPERLSLVGRSSGRVFGPGTELDIQVAAVDIERSDVILSVAPSSLNLAPTGKFTKKKQEDRGNEKEDRRRRRREERREKRGRR